MKKFMDSVTFWGCTLKVLGILLKKGVPAEKKNPSKKVFEGRYSISSIYIFIDNGFSAFFMKDAFFP